MVGHETIFAGHEDVLPTFNSVTIETMICFIPGLADKFIYFNDDIFSENSEILAQQIVYRFRDFMQFSPVSLTNHLKIIKNGVQLVPSERVATVKASKNKLNMRVLADIDSGDNYFGCVQGLKKASDGDKREIIRTLTRKTEAFLPSQIVRAWDP